MCLDFVFNADFVCRLRRGSPGSFPGPRAFTPLGTAGRRGMDNSLSILPAFFISGNNQSMGPIRAMILDTVGAAFHPAVVQPWVNLVGFGLSSMT